MRAGVQRKGTPDGLHLSLALEPAVEADPEFGAKSMDQGDIFIYFLETNHKFLKELTENKPFHLPRLPMWTLDP